MVVHLRGFSPVAPVHILQQLSDRNELGYYHLVLAHDVLDRASEFRRLFRNTPNKWSTILVDNSVIELGHPVEPRMIVDACNVFRSVGVHTVVPILPDELLDCKGTIKVATEALNAWCGHKIPGPYMFVPQGRTMPELIECAEALACEPEIGWIGVARNLTGLFGTRWDATMVLKILYPKCKFHMLGFSDKLVDDMMCTRLPGIEGIDSAVPVRIDIPISLHPNEIYPPRGNWWNEVQELSDTARNNIRTVRKWLTWEK